MIKRMNRYYKIGLCILLLLSGMSVARAAQVAAEDANQSGEARVEALQGEIKKIMYVQADAETNTNDQAFEDNINAVQDNQNKMMMNAATRAVAMGDRAVALATTSGKQDIQDLRDKLEKAEDLMTLLDGIATVYAQNLQKISEITALRAKMLELNSLNSIISSGTVFSTEDSEQQGGQP